MEPIPMGIPNGMYLKIVETHELIMDPNDIDIIYAIMLSPGTPATGVVLNKGMYDFIQTTRNLKTGYALEYLNPKERLLFHIHWISIGQVISAMLAYAKGCHCWKTWFDWQYWGAVKT